MSKAPQPQPSSRAQVVGLGLVGASIAGALTGRGWHVTGSDSDTSRQNRALELGVVAATGHDSLASIAFVATPASAVAASVSALFAASDRPAELVVTDVAGVKAPIVAAVSEPRFVAGHPMAGSEQEGPDGADPDLFAGATWVLTPTDTTDPLAFATVQQVVSSFGADVVALAADRHDELVAVISHVPHLTSATLMSLAAEEPLDHAALMRLAAGGFRDMTRIAAGSPVIWPDICSDNAEAIVPVLDRLISRLAEVRRIVAESDRTALSELLERARTARRNLPVRGSRPAEVSELRVVVPDRPGVLAEVTTLAGELGVNIYDIEIAHSAEGPRGVLLLVVASQAAETVAAPLRQRGYRVARVEPGRLMGVVIAIDGPGGSGKSTVAKALATRLGCERLDTGAMYRAVTLLALREATDLADGATLSALARSMVYEGGAVVWLNGQDVTDEIRTAEVDANVSQVSAHPEVRRELVGRQRAWVAAHGGGVIEGRDIGSVVLPDADLKIYLTASAEVRSRRRADPELARRDALDSGRAASPLVVPDGSIVIDSTDRSVEQVVEEVLSHL